MHWWPARISRRTMFAPMRPRPIIPSCMKNLSLKMRRERRHVAFVQHG
jgi:hypothetical protein